MNVQQDSTDLFPIEQVEWKKVTQEFRQALREKNEQQFSLYVLADAIRTMQVQGMTRAEVSAELGRTEGWLIPLYSFFRLSLAAQAYFSVDVEPRERLRMDELRLLLTQQTDVQAQRAANLSSARKKSMRRDRLHF